MQSNKSNGQLTAQIEMTDHKKSGFDLSNNVLGTGRIGRIIPTRALHVMPGDTIKQDSKVAVQFEPLAVPILANMDVKQEHFYVPYNVVWKNWDKFISGGEKLDYQGVVPSVSMKRIVYIVKYIFDSSVNGRALFIPLSISNLNGQTTYYLDVSRLPWTEDYELDNTNLVRTALDYVGDKFKIKDLLAPCYETIEKMQELDILHRSDIQNEVPMFVEIFLPPNAPDSQWKDTIKDYINGVRLNGNVYVKTLVDALVKIAKNNGSIIMPTELAMDYLINMYEFYKPFYGTSSNIDYLNMGRVTFTDFLFSILLGINEQRTESNNADIKDIYPLSDAFNESPLSVLNLRANYNIWYNNYRDILLEADAFEPAELDSVTSDELFVLLVPRQRCWEKDAFTTALDNPGTGNVGVPVTRSTTDTGYVSDPMYVKKINTIVNNGVGAESATENDMEIAEISFGGETWKVPTAFLSGQNEFAYKDSAVSGFSLYALDAAQRAQKWLQKALFFGNRISDFYYMHFGVRFLDARLRLPELLTSSSELVRLDVVMNNTNITTEANGEVFQSIAGDRAAYASAYDNGNSFDRFCEEHGVIMSYLTIMPQVTYAYGINRDYSRLDQYDFAFSEFATLGMDAVYDTEITATPISKEYLGDADVKVFGYQGKYYDYKAKHSEEHGELLTTQNMYTFARHFNMYDEDGRPKLNYEFVHCFPDLDMFVVDSTLADYFRYDVRHSTAAERNLPSQSLYI